MPVKWHRARVFFVCAKRLDYSPKSVFASLPWRLQQLVLAHENPLFPT
jgi:hypothetical protein